MSEVFREDGSAPLPTPALPQKLGGGREGGGRESGVGGTGDWSANYKQAYCHYLVGEYSKAKDEFTAVIKSDGSSADMKSDAKDRLRSMAYEPPKDAAGAVYKWQKNWENDLVDCYQKSRLSSLSVDN